MLSPDIVLRIPSKYSEPTSSSPSPSRPSPPPLSWLLRTWTVCHSTLPMWRSARNVRITYTALPPSSSGAARVDDLVEYEALSGKGDVKRITGVDTSTFKQTGEPTANAGNKKGAVPDEAAVAEWNWRGKGWLFFVSSHWEVLAWGEEKVADVPGDVRERWVVTWFAPTIFSAEGVDFYSDRREGLSEGVRRKLMDAFQALRGGPAERLAEMVGRDMKEVACELPWKES